MRSKLFILVHIMFATKVYPTAVAVSQKRNHHWCLNDRTYTCTIVEFQQLLLCHSLKYYKASHSIKCIIQGLILTSIN